MNSSYFTSIFCAGMLWWVSLAAAAERRVEIRLENALGYPAKGGAEGERDLFIQTTRSDGEGFDWLLGQAPDFNRGLHRGRVLGDQLESRGELEIEFRIGGDPWVPGGRGRYTLELERRSDTEWRGTYRGSFEQIPGRGNPAHVLEVAGEAVMRLTEPLEPSADFTPPPAGAHPRLLVSHDGVGALRKKSTATPAARALRQRISGSDSPVAVAMRSLLEADPELARSTMDAVRKKLRDESPGAFNGSDGAYAKRVGEIVKIYDLCYPHWPDSFQEEVNGLLARKAEKMLFRPTAITRKTNWSPNSNYSGHFNGAGGLAGLALLGKPGPRPVPPIDPGGAPKRIEPPSDVDLPDGAPVETFTPGITSGRWWVLGPVPTVDLETAEEVPPLFGAGRMNEMPDTERKVEVGDKTYRFADRGEEIFWMRGGEEPQHRNLELMRTTGKQYYSSVVFFTVLDVKEAGTYQFKELTGGGHASEYWISGEQVVRGDLVRLEAGRHPFRVVSRFFKINPWGKAWMRPNFRELKEGEIDGIVSAIRTLYELELAEYRENLAYWQANDGASPRYRWIFLCGTQKATEYHRFTFGDGGFQTEGEVYTSVGADLPMLFETCYVNRFGHPSTGRPDVTHVGPRYVAQTVYALDGPEAQQSFSLTDGTQPVRRWPLGFPVIPDKWKPACLWAWNLGMGIEHGGAGRAASDRDAAFGDRLAAACGDPVTTLLYYPMELEPANPEGMLPRVWEAETKGLYVFRNGWNGPEKDIVAQAFLKAEGEGGWKNRDAGSIRLWGLGTPWTVRGKGVGKTRDRHSESVLLLPGLDHNKGMRARKEAFQAFEDGSGLIRMNLDRVYAWAKPHPEKEDKRIGLVDNRFQMEEENLLDTGVGGFRTVAVDLSGDSGAAAVLVTHDRVEGHGDGVWRWQLPESVTRDQVMLEEDGFTIRNEYGVLRARFHSPAPVEVRWTDTAHARIPAKDRATKKESYSLHALEAVVVGGGEIDLLAVITLDPATSPDIPVLRRGGAWRVDAGRRLRLGVEESGMK